MLSSDLKRLADMWRIARAVIIIGVAVGLIWAVTKLFLVLEAISNLP